MGIGGCKRRMAAPRKRLPPFFWTESAMRPPQSSLTAAEVQHLFAHWLAPVLGPFPAVRRATAAAVTALLPPPAPPLSSLPPPGPPPARAPPRPPPPRPPPPPPP